VRGLEKACGRHTGKDLERQRSLRPFLRHLVLLVEILIVDFRRIDRLLALLLS
jgi:hypothetical protein